LGENSLLFFRLNGYPENRIDLTHEGLIFEIFEGAKALSRLQK